jgi:hypothetical protein
VLANILYDAIFASNVLIKPISFQTPKRRRRQLHSYDELPSTTAIDAFKAKYNIIDKEKVRI